MLMKSEELLKIRKKLDKYLKNKDIEDVILFGSFTKGKSMPADIDVLVLSDKKIEEDIPGLHITFMSLAELYEKFPLMMSTILKEGYSLKHSKYIAEYFRFSSQVMFCYELKNLNASKKVKIVNILRGISGRRGLVAEKKGEWISNSVFIISPEYSSMFEGLFIEFGIKFTKKNLLIH